MGFGFEICRSEPDRGEVPYCLGIRDRFWREGKDCRWPRADLRIDTLGASWHGLRMEVYNAKLLTTTTTALWRADLL